MTPCLICGEEVAAPYGQHPFRAGVPEHGYVNSIDVHLDARTAIRLEDDVLSNLAYETLQRRYGVEAAQAEWAEACNEYDAEADAQMDDDYARASEIPDAAVGVPERRVSPEIRRAITHLRNRAGEASKADPVAAALLYVGAVLEAALLD